MPKPRRSAAAKPADKPRARTDGLANGRADDAAASQEGKRQSGTDRLNAYGEDAVIADIKSGASYSKIAARVGCSKGQIAGWLSETPERSARARAARSVAASLYDDMAMQAIEEAADPFELAKAKELAHHLRWRAKVVNPREYGDKIDVTQDVSVRQVSDDALAAQLAALGVAVKLGGADAG